MFFNSWYHFSQSECFKRTMRNWLTVNLCQSVMEWTLFLQIEIFTKFAINVDPWTFLCPRSNGSQSCSLHLVNLLAYAVNLVTYCIHGRHDKKYDGTASLIIVNLAMLMCGKCTRNYSDRCCGRNIELILYGKLIFQLIFRLFLRDNLIKWDWCPAVRPCVNISQKQLLQKYLANSDQIWYEASGQCGLVLLVWIRPSKGSRRANNPQIWHFV